MPPEPVSPEPTPPAPEPVPTPPAGPPAGAQSASAEEDTIKAQIESFVNQNNQTAPGSNDGTPAAPAEPAPKEASKPEPKPATPESNDDALMASAVKSLITEDEEKLSDNDAAPAPTIDGKATMPAPAVVTPAPQTEPTPPAPAADTESEANDKNSEDDGVTVAHKKIISPISAGENVPRQPDLNELLAKEGFTTEDIHASPQPNPQNPTGLPQAPHPPGHIISPNPAGDQGGVDPNSIAL
jgi:hypothetical protein